MVRNERLKRIVARHRRALVVVLLSALAQVSACDGVDVDVDDAGGGPTPVDTRSATPSRTATAVDGATPTPTPASTPDGSAKGQCLEGLRSGQLATAASQCGDAADDGDPEAAVIAGSAELVQGTFDSSALRGTLEAFGFQLTGSAVDACATSFERPTSVPAGAPRGAAVQQLAREQGIILIDRVLARTADVPSTFNTAFDVANFPPCIGRSLDAPIEFDGGDVLLARSGLNLLAAALHFGAAYDLDLDIAAAANGSQPLQTVFTANPSLLTLKPGSASELGAARQRLDRALADFVAGVDAIDAESDDQSDDFLIIQPSERSRAIEFRNAAERLRSALEGTGTFEAPLLGLSSDQQVSLATLFAGDVATLRPFVAGSFDAEGDLDACQLPDPTFGGMAPDLTQAEIAQVLQLECP